LNPGFLIYNSKFLILNSIILFKWPSLKEVRSRIQSVTSTQQITKAMKMVAAAKLRRAQDNIVRMRPYALRLNTILANLTRNDRRRTC
jgi:ATP synthase F1 gamma subunit